MFSKTIITFALLLPALASPAVPASGQAKCEDGLHACLNKGSLTAYECVNFLTSATNCGGCVHGVFGNPSGTSGFNCESGIGAKLEDVCDNGHCVPRRDFGKYGPIQ